MGALAAVRRAAVLCLAIAPPFPAAVAEDARPPGKPVCLNAADTRDMVKSRKFLEPYLALKFAAAQKKAEALSAKLCHTGDEFFYEITVLHHDGKLVRVEVDADSPKPALRASHEAHEAPARDRASDKN